MPVMETIQAVAAIGSLLLGVASLIPSGSRKKAMSNGVNLGKKKERRLLELWGSLSELNKMKQEFGLTQVSQKEMRMRVEFNDLWMEKHGQYFFE